MNCSHSLPDIGTTGGNSITGDAEGGRGDGKGPGGNAYTGAAGPTRGGSIGNEGGSVENTGMTSKSIQHNILWYAFLTRTRRRRWRRW